MNPHAVLDRLHLSRRFARLDEALEHPLHGPVMRAWMRDRARLRKDRPMHIIGLTGFPGAGKDTIAELLVEKRPAIARAAFADALKVEVAAAFGVDVSLFHDPAAKEVPHPSLAPKRCSDPAFRHFLGTLDWLAELRPRTVMQQWGDYRRAQHPDYWIRLVEPSIAAARALGAHAVLITDVRLSNELAWLRREGGVLWRVTRPWTHPSSGHASNWQIYHERADLAIANDGFVEMLAKRVLDAYDQLVLTRGVA